MLSFVKGLHNTAQQYEVVQIQGTAERGFSTLLRFPGSFFLLQEPTDTSKQPTRTRYLGHVTGYQPIRDQYFLNRSVPAFCVSPVEVSVIYGGSKFNEY
eukprot:sb/3478659/